MHRMFSHVGGVRITCVFHGEKSFCMLVLILVLILRLGPSDIDGMLVHQGKDYKHLIDQQITS